MKYRSKPVIVEAWQVTPFDPIPPWALGLSLTKYKESDWFIWLDDGRTGLMSDEDFKETFEPVGEE